MYLRNRLTAFCSLVLVLLLPVHAVAEDGAFYFIGTGAPIGSISSDGQNSRGIYLRWDAVVGQLPSDVSEFELRRDGNLLTTIPAFGSLSVGEIQNLYKEAGQDRRLQEIIRWLNENSPSVIDENNYASEIFNKLNDPDENYWAVNASRNDFNIARARFRGYLDTKATGNHEYELIAVSNAGTPRRIGLAVIDLNSATILDKAASFTQIIDMGRCDVSAERYKNNGVIALNWDLPANTTADRYIASIATSGYDIYRTVEQVPAINGSLDIRLLAAASPHDPSGRVSLPGLEKLNDQPILVSGSTDVEQTNEGWNPDFFQYMETATEVAEKGLRPGDSRAYYIVARDFTGNYGATEGLLVTVPDTVAPPAPWSVRTVKNVETDSFSLQWDQVDLLNYHKSHQNGRTYCNLNTARFDGELRYVPEGENCDDHHQRVVDLKIKDYLVYRFLNSEDAANFSDMDGDGFSDISERIPAPGNPNLTLPGTACDAATGPASGKKFLVPGSANPVPATAFTSRKSGRKVIIFEDAAPANNKGLVYWYRIASRDLDGNVSALSEPVRGFFPERKTPASCGLDSISFGSKECGYSLNVHAPVADKPYALDLTGTADYVATSCFKDGTTNQGNFVRVQSYIRPLDDGTRGADLSDVHCSRLTNDCGNQAINISYEKEGGEVLASGPAGIMPKLATCDTVNRSELRRNCKATFISPIEGGDIITGEPVLKWGIEGSNCQPTANTCINIYRDIGDEAFREQTICPNTTGELELDLADLPSMGGDSVCLSFAISNENGEVSGKTRLPCFSFRPDQAPSTPQPLDITFAPGLADATVSWLPSEQPVTGTLIEWYKNGDNETVRIFNSDFIPHSGITAKDGIVSVVKSVGVEPTGTDWSEEWCFRIRSVGKAVSGDNGSMSGWSQPLCGLRLPVAAVPPEYIPWPGIETPPLLGGLSIKYLPDKGWPVTMLSEEITPTTLGCDLITGIQACDVLEKGGCNLQSGPTAPKTQAHQCVDFCSAVTKSLRGNLGFVVYRQSTSDTADPTTFSSYVQVSPLIGHAQCERTFTAPAWGGPLSIITSTLDDPFIKLLEFRNSGGNWDGIRAVFVDNYPHVSKRWYRYQYVYFSNQGEITGLRTTSWFQAQ